MGQVFAAFGGQRKVGPAEQLGADDLFELLDAVADRAGRHVQLFRGLGDAAQPRQRLKGQQALDGRDAGSGSHVSTDAGHREQRWSYLFASRGCRSGFASSQARRPLLSCKGQGVAAGSQ
jgi:hypothetical protein